MMKIMMTAIVSLIFSLVMMFFCTMISKPSMKDREKTSPFECGFDPKSSARTPFSIQFFLIAILFLIFDIEIAIMLPVILTMKLSLTVKWLFSITLFIVTLILGLFHEWNNGVLEWIN